MSERCAEMVKLIVCSLREFEQNCTYLHPTLAFITVKESAWEGQVQNMGFLGPQGPLVLPLVDPR